MSEMAAFSQQPSLNLTPRVLHAGADVPEAEAGSGTREAASGAGALQEVFDPATDTLA